METVKFHSLVYPGLLLSGDFLRTFYLHHQHKYGSSAAGTGINSTEVQRLGSRFAARPSDDLLVERPWGMIHNYISEKSHIGSSPALGLLINS